MWKMIQSNNLFVGYKLLHIKCWLSSCRIKSFFHSSVLFFIQPFSQFCQIILTICTVCFLERILPKLVMWYQNIPWTWMALNVDLLWWTITILVKTVYSSAVTVIWSHNPDITKSDDYLKKIGVRINFLQLVCRYFLVVFLLWYENPRDHLDTNAFYVDIFIQNVQCSIRSMSH